MTLDSLVHEMLESEGMVRTPSHPRLVEWLQLNQSTVVMVELVADSLLILTGLGCP